MALCINVGCGTTPIHGWLNFDNSLAVRLARHKWFLSILYRLGIIDGSTLHFAVAAKKLNIRWADATRHIPIPDSSARVLYSSHMLEHLDRDQAQSFLLEARRVLLPGGVLRLAVPDLFRRVEHYNKEGDADQFIKSLNMSNRNAVRINERLKLFAIGNRDHRWMYDAKSLILLLEEAGFTLIKNLPPGVTTIKDSGLLNLHEREDESIYVEGANV